mmetsp:Transcript_38927/g.93664  ORF Transcript_38927/g.93664 Transcript_38927/m.93664 type:complete len:267 (-) Transcript_38927:379-1179(-)
MLLRIPRHLVLDHAIPVAQIYALPNLSVHLLVRLPVQKLVLAKVLKLHERREEVGVDVLEQRVHVHERPFREGRDLVERAGIEVLAHLARYGLKAVVRHPDVLVPIDLEKVPALCVDDEAADPVRVIVLEVEDLRGISQGVHELLLRSVECQLIEFRLVVLREGVVHVESDGANVVEAELAVAEHVIGGDGAMGRQVLQGCEGEVHFVEEGCESPRSCVIVRVAIRLIAIYVIVIGRGRKSSVDATDHGFFREGLFGILVRINVVR